MKPIDCAAFMLIKGEEILAEKRRYDKGTDPNTTAIPGGRVEGSESLDETLIRETREELDILPVTFTYICSLLHISTQFHRVHYYWVSEWEGEIKALEAESLEWIPLSQADRFDLEVDRVAISEYLRYQSKKPD